MTSAPRSAGPRGTRPRVCTIPPHAPFLDVLAGALLDGRLCATAPLTGDPIALSQALIFLPTRRAVRELERVLVARLGGAALLPVIAPLGEEDEDAEAFDPQAWGADPAPAAIGETERRLVFTQMIQAWAAQIGHAIVPHAPGEPLLIPASAADAAGLAAELARLIDSFETENVDWSRLAGLVPEEHDKAWDIIRQFLVIAAEWWPRHLAERGMIGPAAARNGEIARLAERLMRDRPATPIVIAGSTGSNPATADLMAVVAGLDHGAVVLPGLATSGLDEAGWRAVGTAGARAYTHPQHGLQRLLRRLGVERSEVAELADRHLAPPVRTLIATDALRPSATTDRWSAAPHAEALLAEALSGVALVEAANEREEALAIAALLREALEEPDATVALITPDRNLARRVTAELARWGIAADDTGGQPLAGTPAGILARLVASAAASRLAPEDLRALIHHCDARFGLPAADVRRAAEILEIGALRGPRPAAGIAGLRAAFAAGKSRASGKHAHPRLKAFTPEDWALADLLLDAIDAAFAELLALHGRRTDLATLAAAHRAANAAIAGDEPVFGRAELERLFDEIAEAEAVVALDLAEYPALFTTLAGWGVVRPPLPSEQRLRVLGTLEARLLNFDRVVLGGLVEGTWPGDARNDPWLSRSMRAALGLPPPEWRVGLSAHDFEQAFGNAEVFLTRALKAGGAPSVASRWLQRLGAVAGKEIWAEVRARGERARAVAARLDDPQRPTIIGEPLPCPALALRPKRLSVTEIETLIRDPYTIYARHVLKLRPLDPIGEEPSGAERGTAIHDALARFVDEGIDPSSPDALDRLLDFGRDAFAPLQAFPDVAAIWWPRFERVARWFLTWEGSRRPAIAASFTEDFGELRWKTTAGREFTLSGMADRIEFLHDGGIAILDYKTGAAPTARQAQSGIAPQLPLEAAMLAAGAFRKAPAGTVDRLHYVRIAGTDPAGEDQLLEFKDASVSELAASSLASLKTLIDRFENEGVPYRARMHPKFKRRDNGDYDHLARIAEWGLAIDGGEEG